MIYIVNENGHFFQITDAAWNSFDRDYLLRAGCDIYWTKEDMYDAISKQTGLCRDEVEGNEITILLNDKNELTERCSRSISTCIEDECFDDWLCGYQL